MYCVKLIVQFSFIFGTFNDLNASFCCQVPDSAILECKEVTDMTGKWFHHLGDEKNCEKPENEEETAK